MRIIREVEACLRVSGIAADIDPERPDLPVGGNRAHQEEDEDQAGEEQQESKPPAPTAFLFASRGLNVIAGLRRLHRHDDGIQDDVNLNRGRFGVIDLVLHRRADLGRGRASNELGQPFLQSFFVQAGSCVIRLNGTPGC
jgi:hypothetical protein